MIYLFRRPQQCWFYELLGELRRDREARVREWEEYKLEQSKLREAQDRKLEAHKLEQDRKWEEQNRKWDENQAELKRLHEEIMAQAQKVDRTIGALGSRWGLQSEKAFRDALAGILEAMDPTSWTGDRKS